MGLALSDLIWAQAFKSHLCAGDFQIYTSNFDLSSELESLAADWTSPVRFLIWHILLNMPQTGFSLPSTSQVFLQGSLAQSTSLPLATPGRKLSTVPFPFLFLTQHPLHQENLSLRLQRVSHICTLERYHFGDKGPDSQSYGFSCSQVQMWELDQKEGWVPKKWCFRTVVLE